MRSWITAKQLENWLEICSKALHCSKMWCIWKHILLISEWITFESLPNRYVTNSFYLFARLPGNLTFLFHGIFHLCAHEKKKANFSAVKMNPIPALRFQFCWYIFARIFLVACIWLPDIKSIEKKETHRKPIPHAEPSVHVRWFCLQIL